MSFRVIEQAYHYIYNKQGRLIFNQRQVPWVAFAELLDINHSALFRGNHYFTIYIYTQTDRYACFKIIKTTLKKSLNCKTLSM